MKQQGRLTLTIGERQLSVPIYDSMWMKIKRLFYSLINRPQTVVFNADIFANKPTDIDVEYNGKKGVISVSTEIQSHQVELK